MKTEHRRSFVTKRENRAFAGIAACLIALLTWHVGPLAAAESKTDSPPAQEKQEDARYSHAQEVLNQPNERGEYSYFVFFEEASATQEQRQRLRPMMSPAERRTTRFDPQDPETIAYRQLLDERQKEHIASIEAELGRELRIVSRFDLPRNRITTWLKPEEAERVARIPGVSLIGREPPPPGLGFDQSASDVRARGGVWQPFPDGTDAKGLGKVIAILDSGIDILHPAFQNEPRCGMAKPEIRPSCWACSTARMRPERAVAHSFRTLLFRPFRGTVDNGGTA